ncbi:response regulator [Novispirillum sp. DQ9]|uniref:response regulator n=1 Tax=Novispirillum sp. DQ9 TaxID=3398612 RepID=UPI003C7B5C84
MTQEEPHVLVVDDDERLRTLLRRYLSDNGFVVTTAADAAEARAALATMVFDLLVVDVMMPGEDGLALTRSLRQDGNTVPVLMLTARGEAEDRIAGLEHGADDYLPKPFEPRELVLRLTSILRRARQPAPQPVAEVAAVSLGALVFDPARRELRRGEERVALTEGETDLLAALARHADPVEREDLAAEVGLDGNLRSVDVQVTRLRRKIEDDPRQPRFLLTVRGKGYVLRPG